MGTEPIDDSTDVRLADEEGATERVLRFTLDVPAECSFRKAGSVNGLPTYSIPPLTTIRGMIYNALGRPSLLLQYNYRYRTMPKEQVDAESAFRAEFEDRTAIGIRIVNDAVEASHLRSFHKRDDSSDPAMYKRAIGVADTLIGPTYRVYLAVNCDGETDGMDDEPLGIVHDALIDPARPLYLGRSDDLVVVRDVEIVGAERVSERKRLDCVVPGGTGDEIEMLPVRSDTVDWGSSSPSSGRVVSVDGGMVDEHLETTDERFVLIDERQ
jgi:CRISPR-associated protein Cas5h